MGYSYYRGKFRKCDPNATIKPKTPFNIYFLQAAVRCPTHWPSDLPPLKVVVFNLP